MKRIFLWHCYYQNKLICHLHLFNPFCLFSSRKVGCRMWPTHEILEQHIQNCPPSETCSHAQRTLHLVCNFVPIVNDPQYSTLFSSLFIDLLTAVKSLSQTFCLLVKLLSLGFVSSGTNILCSVLILSYNTYRLESFFCCIVGIPVMTHCTMSVEVL